MHPSRSTASARPPRAGPRRPIAVVVAVLLLVGSATTPVARAADDGDAQVVASGARAVLDAVWGWPLRAPVRVDRPYIQPAHDYAPGHRGIDLFGDDGDVLAPADGVVVFAGRVVDRSLVTIDHGGGLVSTLEPVDPLVEPGDRVREGDRVATLSIGGHAEPGRLHLGARLDGAYVNPLLLLGGVPHAVLLPCCT